jgi:hypothetical protein
VKKTTRLFSDERRRKKVPTNAPGSTISTSVDVWSILFDTMFSGMSIFSQPLREETATAKRSK